MLSPPPELLVSTDPRGDNDRSCVLLVEGSGGRLLLPGDISSRIEPAHRGRDADSRHAARARRAASRQPHIVERRVHRGAASGARDRLGRLAQPLRTSASGGRRALSGRKRPVAEYGHGRVHLRSNFQLPPNRSRAPSGCAGAATGANPSATACCPLGSTSQSGGASRCYDSRLSAPRDLKTTKVDPCSKS